MAQTQLSLGLSKTLRELLDVLARPCSSELTLFRSLEQSVKEDISLLRQSPFLPKELVESAVGFTYDIKTGKLTPVQ